MARLSPSWWSLGAHLSKRHDAAGNGWGWRRPTTDARHEPEHEERVAAIFISLLHS